MRRALAFLTPFGGAAVPDARTLGWFPLVGAFLGSAVGALWWGAERLWPPLVAAALVVAADMALTGLLHFDGLIDSADGLLAPLDRERRLAVMSQPGAGAFGVTVAAVVVVARVAALAALAPSVPLVAALWCASRTVMAVAARTLPYARPGGLADAFLGGPAGPVAALGATLTIALGIAVGLDIGSGGGSVALAAVVAAVIAAVVASGGVLALARRRLGGFTGDVLGAAGVVGETAGLLVAAARW